jgi:hypothetical protein
MHCLAVIWDQSPVWINPLWILLGSALGIHSLWKAMKSGTIILYIMGSLVLAGLSLQAGLRQQREEERTEAENQQRAAQLNIEQEELNQQLGIMSNQESSIAKQIGQIGSAAIFDTTKPDIGLVWVDKAEPSLEVVNLSAKKPIDQPKYVVALFNLDVPSTIDPEHRPTILQIPAQTGDFIRPNERSGPTSVFDPVKSTLKHGDRLFGFTRVMCPDCQTDRDYWVYIVWGSGGWYAPVKPRDYLINLDSLFKVLPQIVANSEAALSELVPPSERIEIKNRS